MTKIEEYLRIWPDQRLANLQCAAEDGTLVYSDCGRCLLHHFEGNYSLTKWEGKDAALARAAEMEYLLLGGGNIEYPFVKEQEDTRRAAMLPMIHAEWTRRGKTAEIPESVVYAETT